VHAVTEKTRKLEQLLENVEELPTLPHVVARISRMTVNPRTNAADIGKLISNDPALSSKILKLVNSSYYGFPRRISSVTKAIVLLGFAKVKNMAISAAVVDVFRNADEVDGFDFFQYWKHAVANAIAAEVIGKRLLPSRADDCFVGGLLAETGKVLLACVIGNKYSPALARARSAGMSMQEAETELLGTDYARAGAMLAENWNFPEALVEVIRYAHEPYKARGERAVCEVVNIANSMVSALGQLGAGEPFVPFADPDAWRNLRMSETLLSELFNDFQRAFESAGALLDLAL
jgi:HD-like signal output (HDOD) protein